MNPKNWSRNEQIAAVITAIVGLFIGIVVGYIVYATGRGAAGALPFGRWLDYPLRLGVVWWALTGATIGVAVIYVRRLTSKPE